MSLLSSISSQKNTLSLTTNTITTFCIPGDQYYKYKDGDMVEIDGKYIETMRRVEPGYPKHLSLWEDITDMWKYGQTYFFSGYDYYQYNDIGEHSLCCIFPRLFFLISTVKFISGLIFYYRRNCELFKQFYLWYWFNFHALTSYIVIVYYFSFQVNKNYPHSIKIKCWSHSIHTEFFNSNSGIMFGVQPQEIHYHMTTNKYKGMSYIISYKAELIVILLPCSTCPTS